MGEGYPLSADWGIWGSDVSFPAGSGAEYNLYSRRVRHMTQFCTV